MNYRQIIESGGAEFLGVFGKSVRFRDRETGSVLSLYVAAFTPENVQLTLKDAREKVLDFAPWEATQ